MNRLPKPFLPSCLEVRFFFHLWSAFIKYNPSSSVNIRIPSIDLYFFPLDMSCYRYSNTETFPPITFSHDTLYVPSFLLFISFIFNPPSSPCSSSLGPSAPSPRGMIVPRSARRVRCQSTYQCCIALNLPCKGWSPQAKGSWFRATTIAHTHTLAHTEALDLRQCSYPFVFNGIFVSVFFLLKGICGKDYGRGPSLSSLSLRRSWIWRKEGEKRKRKRLGKSQSKIRTIMFPPRLEWLATLPPRPLPSAGVARGS